MAFDADKFLNQVVTEPMSTVTVPCPEGEYKAFVDDGDKGVTFLQEPAERPYGVEAVCRDNSGNWLVLVEPREFSPEDFTATT